MCNFSGLEGNAQKKPCCCMAVNNCLELICNYNYEMKSAPSGTSQHGSKAYTPQYTLPIPSLALAVCTILTLHCLSRY